MILSFIMKGIYIFATNEFSVDSMILPYIYIIIFFCAFLLGFTISSKVILLEEYEKLSNRIIINIKSLRRILFFLSIISGILFVSKIGLSGLTSVFNNVLGNRILFQNQGGLYGQTIILVFLQFSLYTYIIAMYETYHKIKKDPFFIYLIVINIFIPMTLGGRGMIFTPIIMSFFIISSYSEKNNYLALIILGIGIVLFSGWYGMFRDGIADQSSGTGDLIKNVLDRYVQLDNLTRLVNNPVYFPFGKSITDFLYSPIPRSILPDKPYNFNSQMTQIYLPLQFQNKIVSDFTAIGELLVNFRVFGIFIGGLFFGKIIDIFNYIYLYGKGRFFYVWYPFFMLTPMSLLYGGFINSTANMMIILEVPMIIILWLVISRKSELN